METKMIKVVDMNGRFYLRKWGFVDGYRFYGESSRFWWKWDDRKYITSYLSKEAAISAYNEVTAYPGKAVYP